MDTLAHFYSFMYYTVPQKKKKIIPPQPPAFGLGQANHIHITGYISPSPAAEVKFFCLTHPCFPVFLPEISDDGGEGEVTQIRLYSLSSLPHSHAMDKDMINSSGSNFI